MLQWYPRRVEKRAGVGKDGAECGTGMEDGAHMRLLHGRVIPYVPFAACTSRRARIALDTIDRSEHYVRLRIGCSVHLSREQRWQPSRPARASS